MTTGPMPELCAYCRIDVTNNADVTLLASMEASAREYLANAGIAEPAETGTGAALYRQTLYAMVLDLWENRGTQSAGVSLTENPAFRRQLNQLKLVSQCNALGQHK